MARKIALLIGVGQYGPGLETLNCPANGVEAMRSLLQNPSIGEFDQVISLVDPNLGEMRSRIGETFAESNTNKEDLVLFYFTGHGIKDGYGNFYLTTAESYLFENGEINAGTAVEADFLKGALSRCWAERKVVILDCCFAGAIADGFTGMDDGSIDIAAQLGTKKLGEKGCCILTASTSNRYALEPKDADLSVYTRYLTDGLRTGGAALEGQRFISARQIHDYVKAQVKVAAPAMKPAIFNALEGDRIAIAKVHIDNEQRYRKQVQAIVKQVNGRLRPSARANLKLWQRELGITNAKAATILAEVMKPYEEKAKHVEFYRQALIEEKEYSNGLEVEAIEQLQAIKQRLNLRDKDVLDVEKAILGASLATVSSVGQVAQNQQQLPQPANHPPPPRRPAISTPSPRQYSTRNRLPTRSVGNRLQDLSNTISRRKALFLGLASVGIGSTVAIIDSLSRTSPDHSTISSADSDSRTSPDHSTISSADSDFIPVSFSTVKVNSTGEIISQEERQGQAYKQDINGQSLELMSIPGGTFQMGSPPDQGQDDERPQHEVTVPAFSMGRYTVTQAQWKAVAALPAVEQELDSDPSFFKGENRPVENVSWNDAVEFCRRLSRYSDKEYRLPSEAEWEYACRAGTTTPFHFGETLTSEIANYNANYTYGDGPKGEDREETTEVGLFPANDFGLCDMHGNVWEWCLDGWHNSYEGAPSDGSAWESSDERKIVRGGSWLDSPSNCRAALRYTGESDVRPDFIGFRVCSFPRGR